jgi:hypothetical protein
MVARETKDIPAFLDQLHPFPGDFVLRNLHVYWFSISMTVEIQRIKRWRAKCPPLFYLITALK